MAAAVTAATGTSAECWRPRSEAEIFCAPSVSLQRSNLLDKSVKEFINTEYLNIFCIGDELDLVFLLQNKKCH